jgi:hypothetical protein
VDGISEQRSGRGAKDPVTGNVVRRMKLNTASPAQQRWVWALQHFSKYTIGRFKERSIGPGGPADAQWWLVFHMAAQAVVGVVILVSSLVAVVASVSSGYLEHNDRSWIPTGSCVVFGGSFTFFAFALMRLAVARRMNKTHDAAPNGDRLTDRFLNRISTADERRAVEDAALWADDEHDSGTEMGCVGSMGTSVQKVVRHSLQKVAEVVPVRESEEEIEIANPVRRESAVESEIETDADSADVSTDSTGSELERSKVRHEI